MTIIIIIIIMLFITITWSLNRTRCIKQLNAMYMSFCPSSEGQTGDTHTHAAYS